MSIVRKVINLTISGNKLIAVDSEGNSVNEAGIHGENNAVVFRMEIPDGLTSQTVNLYAVSDAGTRDMATAVNGVIYMLIQRALIENASKLTVHVEITEGSNVRKTSDCVFSIDESVEADEEIITPTALQQLQKNVAELTSKCSALIAAAEGRITGDVSNQISISARNLIKLTDISSACAVISTQEFSLSGFGNEFIPKLTVLQPNTVYTLQFTVEKTATPSNVISFTDKSIGFQLYSATACIPLTTTEIENVGDKGEYTFKFTAPSVIPADYKLLYYTQKYSNSSGTASYSTVEFTDVSLTRNKGGYLPAPEDLQEKVTDANTAATAALTAATNAVSAIDTLKQTHITDNTDINSAISRNKTTLDNAIKDLVLNSGNLYDDTLTFLDSSKWNNYTLWTSNGTYRGYPVMKRTGEWSGLSQDLSVSVGDIITLSGWVKANGCKVGAICNGTTAKGTGDGETGVISDWTRVSFTFTVTVAGSDFRPCFGGQNSTDEIQVAGLVVTRSQIDTGSRPSVNDIINCSNFKVWEVVYPVGAFYFSALSTSPAVLFGGTWEQIQGRFILACDNNYVNGSTGGEASHTLTISEMPKHSHTLDPATDGYTDHNDIGTEDKDHGFIAINHTSKSTSEVGGGAAHTNMPPYLAAYVWKRTA